MPCSRLTERNSSCGVDPSPTVDYVRVLFIATPANVLKELHRTFISQAAAHATLRPAMISRASDIVVPCGAGETSS